MLIQKPWDKYEAAILLVAYLKTLDGELSRKEAIENTSSQLRALSKICQNNIDDAFRNINGITFQMYGMESTYKGITLLKPASKLFLETTSLFRNNKKQFEDILKEAESMMIVKKKDNRKSYITWLSEKVSPAQLSELYMSYEAIDTFCFQTQGLKQSILETTDINTVKRIQRVIEQNKVFRFHHKREINKFSSAMKYYVIYIKEIYPIDNDSENINVDQCPTNIGNHTETLTERNFSNNQCSAQAEKYITDIIDNSDKKNNETFDTSKNDEIYFSNIEDLSHTKPTYASYFGEEIENVFSWKQLYVNIFKILYEYYDTNMPLNKSFTSNNGRIDFAASEYYSHMIAPKEIVQDRYLETNLNATAIVQKIKALLDICLVDYENLVIKFVYIPTYEQQVSNGTNLDKDEKNDKNKEKYIDSEKFDKNNFSNWLIKDQGIAPTTCRSYLSSISLSERFATMHHLQHNRLYDVSYNEAKCTYDELLRHHIFIEYNRRSHNQLRSGLNKLLLFLSSNISEPIIENSIDEEFKAQIQVILNEKFKKGYRLGSPIELRKFKKFWVSEHNEEIKYSDDKIEQYIKSCGVVHEEKLYTTQSMASAELQAKLISYIKDGFGSGKTALYYTVIFNEFSELFLDYCMYSADMLKAYLSYINDGSYYINRSYIAKNAYTNADPIEEIRTCLIEKFTPMTYEEIFDVLSHIPEQKIRQILACNDDFISNGKGQYFHASIATLSDDELEDIKNIIQFSIDEKSFISGNELVDSIKQKYPYIIEQNTLISDKGLRDVIGYKLKSIFSFKGNIISSQGHALSMMDVFADFCKHKDAFTLDELRIFKQELDTTIYFDAVYENSLRISKNEFVSKSQAHFQVEKTDETINLFCTQDYIAIGKIEQFGLFPDAGFSWNNFLLECFVHNYSRQYKLIQPQFTENYTVGAIVKKVSYINNFDDLVVDVLAKSGLNLTKDVALQYLCDEGYLVRRSNSGIEQILIKAKELRNQKGL